MNGNVEYAERLTRVEAAMKHYEDEREEAREARQKTLEMLTKVNDKLEKLDKEMTHYKGVIGGITLVLSGIGVVIMFFKAWVFAKLGIEIKG